MQFEKTDQALTIHETVCFLSTVIFYFFIFLKSKSTSYFTINVVSFLNTVLPTLIYRDIADTPSSNITRSSRYHALY